MPGLVLRLCARPATVSIWATSSLQKNLRTHAKHRDLAGGRSGTLSPALVSSLGYELQ